MGKKAFWISIILGVLLLLFFVLVSNVITVGDRLIVIHPFLAYGFYAIALVLTYILILNPLRIIFLAPTFTIDALDEQENRKTYRRAAKTLLKLDYLADEERTLLESHLKDDENIDAAIKTVFQGSIRKEVDTIIVKNAQTVLMTTAISQNGNLDMFAVIFSNLKMIKDITRRCGFRPGYFRLAKLSLNVAVTAMIAEGLEDIDINEAFPTRMSETIKEIPVVRTMTNSIFQGISNGMLTCRIGIVTRKYLFQENRLLSTRQIRLESYKESFRLMPKIISGGLAGFPKGLYNFMIKPFVKNPFTKKGTDTSE